MPYSNFQYIKPFILKWEGGFANHPADPGGATNKGITLTVFRRYFGSDRTVEDLKNITDEQWDYIFKSGYYNKMNANYINNKSIALLCVDMCWGSGSITAIKKIQKCLGTTADGIVGKKTLTLLNADDSYGVFQKLWNMRRDWFYAIVKNRPSSIVFLRGWLNRLNDIRYRE